MILIMGLSRLPIVSTHCNRLWSSPCLLLQQDIFWLQIAVNQSRLAQKAKAVQQLLCKHSHKGGAETSELVLLDQFVQVDRQQFKDKTKMLSVDECVFEAENMMVVVLVHSTVEKIQHRDFHHTLIEVGGSVLDHLDCDHLLRSEILTFDDLAKSSLTQHIEDKVSVFMSRLFTAQDIVDVQNVVAVFVVVAVVLGSF